MSCLDEAGNCDAGESAFAFPSELGMNLRRSESIGSSCLAFEVEVEVEDAVAEDAGSRSVLNSVLSVDPSFFVISCWFRCGCCCC
jgi:hypothetical protein